MTTWKDGGDYGRFTREIINEGRGICLVWTKQVMESIGNSTEPWPEGEANFALILQAPKMLEALEAIVALNMPERGGLGGVLKAYHQHREIARAAIAAIKGENGDNTS